MKSRILFPAAFGLCLTVLALSAGGQTTGNASQPTVAPGKTTAETTTSAGKPDMAPAGAMHKRHARVHHRSRAQHHNRMMGSAGKGREAAYRAALKNCVTGPAAQRESCLDNAIARFRRS